MDFEEILKKEKIRYDENNKAYILLTDEIKRILPKNTIVYGGNKLAPPTCEHEFIIAEGCPRNIKGCKKCVYWEWA